MRSNHHQHDADRSGQTAPGPRLTLRAHSQRMRHAQKHVAIVVVSLAADEHQYDALLDDTAGKHLPIRTRRIELHDSQRQAVGDDRCSRNDGDFCASVSPLKGTRIEVAKFRRRRAPARWERCKFVGNPDAAFLRAARIDETRNGVGRRDRLRLPSRRMMDRNRDSLACRRNGLGVQRLRNHGGEKCGDHAFQSHSAARQCQPRG